MTDNITIIKDISLLYELSLSVGQSLDARENCHQFLRTLIRRKGLSFASVWLHRPEISDEPYCDLFCIYPHFREDQTSVACSQYIVAEIQKKKHLTIASSSPYFEAVMHEKKVAEGSYAIFSLGDLGFLKLFASNRPAGFDEVEMAQLEQVVDKFKISLDGCFAHARIKRETEDRIQAQKSLQVINDRFTDLFENMYDALIIRDRRGNIIEANKAAKRLLGYSFTGSDLINVKDVLHPNDMPNARTFLKKLLTDGFVKGFEGRMVTRNGEIKHIQVNSNIIVTDGKFAGMRDIVRDVTEQKRDEEALTNARVRLTSLIANLQAGILLEDENRHIVLVNQYFCDIFNIPLPPASLVGADCSQSAEHSKHLLADPEGFVAGIAQLTKGREIDINAVLNMADGRILERDYIPLFSQGKYLGHLWQYRDVTERFNAQRTIRESEEKYRGIMENMQLGLLEVDLNQTILHPYPAFCDMLGYQPEDLVGRSALDTLVPPEFHPTILRRDIERKLGASSVYEMQLQKKDGSRMWALISGAPIKNSKGEVVGSIGIHYDLTARKNLEIELAAARRTAEQARLAERQFLANMSHEIRTPMNAVIGMTHLLYDTGPNLVQREYLDSLRFSADSLMSLIDNILDLSKIEAGELELEAREFDLHHLLKSLQQAFQYRVREKSISIIVDLDPDIQKMLLGDATRLSQILTNLLANAGKFTERGTIGIQASLLETDGDMCRVEFRVHDTGIGIAPEKQEDIFGYFKQADVQTTRRFGGTGLGLTIVKQLVELQGGTIRVESELGKGAVFIFNLPFGFSTGENGAQALTPAPTSLQSRAFLQNLEILSVEDNAMNQKLISRIFDSWGCRYQSAANGVEALAYTAKKQFDLILMDIHMPEMDGCDAARAIRNNPENPNADTPLIALTAAALLEEKKRAMEAGMTDFLTKPFSPKMLEECVLRVLETRAKFRKTQAPDFFPKSGKPVEINLEYLMELSNGDPLFVRDMIDTYVSDTPVAIKQIKKAFGQKDWSRIAQLLHKIKPNFNVLGMKEQEEKARMLEEMIKKGDFEPGTLDNVIRWLDSSVQYSIALLEERLALL